MKKANFLFGALIFLLYIPIQQPLEETDDPFLWLEEIEGGKALKWVKEKNKISKNNFAKGQLFEAIFEEILEIRNSDERIADPQIAGNYVYNLWQDDRNKRGLWRKMPLEDYIRNKSDWEIVLDIDSLSESENKQWIFKGAAWLEPENQRCIISLSDGGSDATEKREFDAESKSFVKDGFNIPESINNFSWINKNCIYIGTDFGESSLTQSGRPRILKRWQRGTTLEEATSKDGTKIPYFLLYKKGFEFDGQHPTLLYGYGGFGISKGPEYLDHIGKAWLERGGIYVLAIIRGGGEFGPSWHQAALKEKRQNSFDDFHAVAQDLINKKVTSPKHLGIQGESNGGLLVGVAFTQHPELYNAVVCAVPLLDMKRYNKLLFGGGFDVFPPSMTQ
jgi:prolyl oligopeptidase PreP (S9A serine peptidase family)